MDQTKVMKYDAKAIRQLRHDPQIINSLHQIALAENEARKSRFSSGYREKPRAIGWTDPVEFIDAMGNAGFFGIMWTFLIQLIYIIPFCIACFVLLSPMLLGTAWDEMRRDVPNSLFTHAWLAATLVMIALCFYRVRTRRRSLYAAAEIFAGCVGCWMALGSLTIDSVQFTLAIASSIYVIVRGCDNLAQSIKAQQMKVVNTWSSYSQLKSLRTEYPTLIEYVNDREQEQKYGGYY